MLTKTQSSLETHFDSLARSRAGLGYPVYALEHGLTSEEIAELRETLSAELTNSSRLNHSHWLLWIIVATEFGYAYDGEEYWRSFAKAIPNWNAFGDRNTIRSWFGKFQERWSGFLPKGDWARHFSIISWPITHAILPKDLQGQFAKRLYERRYELASAINDIEEIGKIARLGDKGNSSRFENFLEHPELSGRLILAMRDEDVGGKVPSIHPPTLSRIIADLETRRVARDWLKDARSVLREARMRTSLVRFDAGTFASNNNDPSKRINNLRLIARQMEDSSWRLGVLIPDLNQIIKAADIKTKTLDLTRVRFADQEDMWYPGRAVLSWSGREQPVRSLEFSRQQPFLLFEKSIPSAVAYFEDHLKLVGEPPWLLRLQEDRLARQIFGNHIRSGQTYLLITPTEIDGALISRLNLRSQVSQTKGAHVYCLTVPPVLTREFINALSLVRLGYSLRANIEPVGLVSRWDATGARTVWLANEEVLLRLTADCPVEEFVIQVDGSERSRITPLEPDGAVVSLGSLSIGPHNIEVSCKSTVKLERGTSQLLEPELLQIEVRAPIPWQETVRDRSGFKAFVEPDGASLELLLKGKAHIQILGPAERPVAVEIRTYDGNGHIADRIPLGRIPSCTDKSALREIIAKVAKEPVAERIQPKPRVDFVFQADELGIDVVSFSRKVRPLYWKLEKNHPNILARLIDETDSGSIEVDRYSITEPAKRIAVDQLNCLEGVRVDPPGSLLTAKYGGHHYQVVVSAPGLEKMSDLSQLGIPIAFTESESSPRFIPKLIFMYRLWKHALTLGPLVIVRKSEVVEAIENQITRIVCGASWTYHLSKCSSDADDDQSFKRLKSEIGGSPGFALKMHRNDWTGAPDAPGILSEFKRLSKVYQIENDEALCEVALRLAFKPESLKFASTDEAEAILSRLAQNHSLARGAFVAKFSTKIREASFLKETAL